MPPEEDAALILQVALRHEASLRAALDPLFPQENWRFLAQQAVENLLKAVIMLSDQPSPLSYDLSRLSAMAQVTFPEGLEELQTFAVKARCSPNETPLPTSWEQLLGWIECLRRDVELAIAAHGAEL